MKVQLEPLRLFASSMAACLRAGMPPRKSLHLSGATSQSPALCRAVDHAIEACDRGRLISEGLQASAVRLPVFIVPIIRAGELSGRQVEAYELISTHCARLKEPMRLVRNTWLFPLLCMAAGWALSTAIFLFFGLYSLAWQFVGDTYVQAAVLTVVGYAVLRMPLGRKACDWIALQIPFVRETIVRSSVVLFLATFRLGYEAGGLSVVQVLDLALATVGNGLIRDDLAQARPILEAHGSFEDAFACPTFLNETIKSSIAAGAHSGHLGASLDQVVGVEALELTASLERFNRIFQRLFAYGVAMSVVGTILLCLSYKQ